MTHVSMSQSSGHDPGNPFDAARVSYEAGQRDMLAKCIAAVEEILAIAQHVDDNGMVSLVYDKGEILDALRALQEKP